MDDNLIQSLKTLARSTARLATMMRDYSKLKDDVVENAYLMEKKVTAIAVLVDNLLSSELKGSISKWLDSERKEVDRAKDEFKFQFGSRLKDLLKSDGLQVRGQYPLLRFGIYTLKLNFELGEATLFFGPEVEKIKSKIPLQPGTIHDIVVKSERDLKVDRSELESLGRDLRTAYERCLKRDGSAYGGKVLITDVLKEYVFMKQPKKFTVDARRENFREYPRAKLSLMLFRLRNIGVVAHGMHLHVATFDATVDRAKTIWVPDNDEGAGTYYEYVSFEHPQD
ncbi:MAG: hypothetical protein JSV53_07615 [candidate division WOR-3 bacterium]|nr:MAG: hypothetical protein JSV53_07615 [candidate division WOR-3 bacterium]